MSPSATTTPASCTPNCPGVDGTSPAARAASMTRNQPASGSVTPTAIRHSPTVTALAASDSIDQQERAQPHRRRAQLMQALAEAAEEVARVHAHRRAPRQLVGVGVRRVRQLPAPADDERHHRAAGAERGERHHRAVERARQPAERRDHERADAEPERLDHLLDQLRADEHADGVAVTPLELHRAQHLARRRGQQVVRRRRREVNRGQLEEADRRRVRQRAEQRVQRARSRPPCTAYLPGFRRRQSTASRPAAAPPGTRAHRFCERSARLTPPARRRARANVSEPSPRARGYSRSVPKAAHYIVYKSASFGIIRGAMLAVHEVTDATALDALERDWSDLLSRAADPTPFQSPRMAGHLVAPSRPRQALGPRRP